MKETTGRASGTPAEVSNDSNQKWLLPLLAPANGPFRGGASMWLIETPWPLFIVFLLISAGLFGQWFIQRRPRQLAVSGIFLFLGVLVIVIEPYIVTPSKRVRTALYDLARSFEKGDVERCVDSFSRQDQADQDLVRQAARMAKIEGRIRITDLSIILTSANSRATTEFRASADVSYLGQSNHVATHWELTWQLEGNEWKVIRIRRLRFVGRDEVQVFSPPQ
jgi:hypothetical protein